MDTAPAGNNRMQDETLPDPLRKAYRQVEAAFREELRFATDNQPSRPGFLNI
jgi:hypothetical protein